jgi:DNA-binding transcriptional ArsR family regulator
VEPRRDRSRNKAFGPVLRPYMLVRGRTRPTGEWLDVIAMVCAQRVPAVEPADLEPEHLEVVRQCRGATSVADLASSLELPLAVVRILVADLRDRGLVKIRRPRAAGIADVRLLREVADGLRRL